MEKPQSPDIQAQLTQARENLQRLDNAVSELVNLSPDVFNDEAIKTRLQEFQQAYEKATQRLANPTFRIATIGTTSSGKSTIVNALMGRRIAPIEAGEMSGGVLTLTHSHERKLVIEATENAVWETGEWTDISDNELYSRIQTAMHSYHEARRKKEYIAPQITAHIPLLPACDANLSGLPEGINVEFLDLPGLKSVQDKTNLAILQTLVGKAFSLVSLDYMQVDEQHRQKLLTELKKVVEYLQGRTDSMIFILNRVDLRSADDKPLEVDLQQLKTEIQEQLNLAELPDIIPFNARLLYYAQCAWGTNPLHTSSNVTPEVRSQLIESLLCDCANIISEKVKGDRDLRNWFRELEDDLEDNNPIDEERIRKLLNYALKWSGGEELWGLIRVKTEQSFFRLVIKPIWTDLVNYYDQLSTLININNSFVEFHNDKNIKRCIKQWEEKIKSVKIEFEQLCSEKFNEIIISCYDEIIVPIYSGFEFNLPADQIEQKLNKFLSEDVYKDITFYYEKLNKSISSSYRKTDLKIFYYFRRDILANDIQSSVSLENDERIFRLLCLTLNEAIKQKINLIIPIKEREILKEIETFKQILVNHLNNAFIFFNTKYSFNEVNNKLTKYKIDVNLPDTILKLLNDMTLLKRDDIPKHIGKKIEYFNYLILLLPRLPLSYKELNKYKNIDTIMEVNWSNDRIKNLKIILNSVINEINSIFYEELAKIKLMFEQRIIYAYI